MKQGFVSHFLEQNRLHPGRGEVVVHIPAKSLSTRLPGKNVRPLNGVPLIGYSVMIANRLRGVDRVFVDTDSPELAEVAAGYGGIEHCKRPPELAREKSRLSDVFNRFMEHLVDRGVTPSAIITLYPTSPFRNLGRTQRLVDALARYCKVYTGVAVRVDPALALDREEDGVFRRTGAGAALSGFKITGNFMAKSFDKKWGPGPGYMHMHYLEHPIEALDLDTEADWEVAEAACSNNWFDFGTEVPCGS